MKVRFRANKTGLSFHPTSPLTSSLATNRSKAVLCCISSLFVPLWYHICGVCFVIICSPSLIRLVLRQSCAS